MTTRGDMGADKVQVRTTPPRRIMPATTQQAIETGLGLTSFSLKSTTTMAE